MTVRRLWARRNPQQRRDQHISRAYKLLHEAVRELQSASHCAYDMGDEGFSTDLWHYTSVIGGSVTGNLSRHLEWVRANPA